MAISFAGLQIQAPPNKDSDYSTVYVVPIVRMKSVNYDFLIPSNDSRQEIQYFKISFCSKKSETFNSSTNSTIRLYAYTFS